MSNTFSVKDICERYAVSEHTVSGWIKSGQLRAFSVSRRLDTKKPRYRVSAEALAEFEAARTPTPPQPRAKRRKRSTDVIEFY